jgi:hypothetical protein
MSHDPVDFFISYNEADKHWAAGLADWLRGGGYTVLVQAENFSPGSNFVLEMQAAATRARRTLAVLSPNYLTAPFPQCEWAAAFADDPTGARRSLIIVRVRECEPKGLLKAIVYIDLCGLAPDVARQTFLSGIDGAVRGAAFQPSRRPSSVKPTEAPIGLQQSIKGNGNIQVGGDYVRTERHTVRPRIEVDESHITEETAHQLQQLITKLVAREVAAGSKREKAYAHWQQALKNKFKVVSYRRIPREESRKALTWLRQQKARNNSKIRRNNPTMFRNDQLGGIHAKLRELGMTKPELYAFATERLELRKPLSSLTELGERNLVALNRLLSAELGKQSTPGR